MTLWGSIGDAGGWPSHCFVCHQALSSAEMQSCGPCARRIAGGQVLCPVCREWHYRRRPCPKCRGLGAKLPARRRMQLLHRLWRIGTRLDSDEVRGTGLNLRGYDWLGRYMEVFDMLRGDG